MKTQLCVNGTMTSASGFMPIVYDPGIADSIENFSDYFITPQNAAYLSIDRPEQMEDALKNAAKGRSIELIVVTDAEAILGIGDWGSNGVNIAIGKLMVYTAAAGIDPAKVLPVVLDAGTARESLLNDPLYLGLHHARVKGAPYYAFVDQFVALVEKLFPHLYLHFEDFGRDNAAKILAEYVGKYPVFNDDIEGTGIITLAGILGALKISKQKLSDQKYLCFGSGTAGCGIVKRIQQEMMDQGLNDEEAKSHFYLVDKQGLLFDDMVFDHSYPISVQDIAKGSQSVSASTETIDSTEEMTFGWGECTPLYPDLSQYTKK